MFFRRVENERLATFRKKNHCVAASSAAGMVRLKNEKQNENEENRAYFYLIKVTKPVFIFLSPSSVESSIFQV